MLGILWPFLIYWLVLFVVCFVVVEFGQKYLYDETTPRVGLKVLGGSFVLAALLTYFRTGYQTMFTSDLAWTVLQAIVWFAVFTLVFQFQPVHGAAVGIATLLIVAGLATIAVESLTNPAAQATPRPYRPTTPLRRPASPSIGGPSALPKAEEAGSKEEPAEAAP